MPERRNFVPNGAERTTLAPLAAHETPVTVGEIFTPAVDKFAAATLGRAINVFTPKEARTNGAVIKR